MVQVSSESRNSFKKIVRAAVAETRVHKKLWIITLVLYGVALLLFAFNGDYRWTAKVTDSTTNFTFIPSVAGSIFAVFGVLIGFFAALNVFRDMNNQQFCDISMALPLRADERFFSRLLSLFFLQVAPLLASTVLGNALAVLIGFFREGMFPQMQGISFFTLPLLYLAGSLFIMAVTVLCACCCGAMAESAYFSLILMFIINLLPPMFFTHLYEICAGYRNVGFIHYTSEGHDFLHNWGFLYLLTIDMEKVTSHCLVGSLISLAVMFLSGLIYKKRDARTVGTPIASRVFFEIMMFLGCATVFSFFMFENEAFWGILVAAVIYIIINVIVSRARIGVKSVLLWVGKYLATTAVCVAVFTAASVTGGFGAIEIRPEAQYLEGASFMIGAYYEGGSHSLRTDPLSAEQADQVMTIYKKHMIAGRKEVGAELVWGKYPGAATYLVARSSVTYPERPSPQWQFTEHYVTVPLQGRRVETGNGSYIEIEEGGYITQRDGTYQLDFNQHVRISDAEARAMMKELSALDFVHEPERTVLDTENDKESYDMRLDPATGLPFEDGVEYA